jgi:nitrogen fixation protein NifU and related proteins
MSDLDALYQSVILDHDRAPRNYGRAEPVTHEAEAYNPLCGDQINVSIALDAGALRQIKFEAQSCAIARASASLMTEVATGLSVAEARRLAAELDKLLRGEASAAASALQALQGVRRFPTRIRCAKLAWTALLDAVKDA